MLFLPVTLTLTKSYNPLRKLASYSVTLFQQQLTQVLEHYHHTVSEDK